MRFVAVILAVLLPAVCAVVVVTRGDDSLASYRSAPPPTDSPLAQRINAACGPGWSVDDWTTGDQFDPLPPGVVQVTCRKTDGSYQTRKVAVSR